ncbi:YegS/Rv2252/BmrU family lipid kinase [Flavobacterium arsenatis]|uniref:YegS/Rv2252/BmrU family lipid kinase n=1 Tax=Flavobacterium arsenatis TaxID=1484332 RepID=A0ABU1TJQ2_9FLAO|nr:diacylglycerol kinase family protein [Flavobacterium arsenatis]MDR6966205.1 YegS/Rv2252/BmrU family lipid kinase [Flavobacterium arsenatis]
MKKNILMVVNPISGDMDKAEFTETAKLFAEKEGMDFFVYETTGKNDEQKIREAFKQHNPHRVLIAGGDGTIKMVADALQDIDVVMGILPAGSANGLSVDLNLPSSLEENLEIAFNSNYMEMDMVCINNIKSLHLSDLGLNAQLVKNYEESSTRGMMGYALQAITTLSEQEEPFKATITANNTKIETVARMIVIANSQKYGTGVTINPNGKMNDGKFEIVILKNLDLIVFAKIISGNIPVDSEDVEIISTDKATIVTDSPVSFQVDGEYIGKESKLDVHILKHQMKVAVP